jgi:hypothetical protein
MLTALILICAVTGAADSACTRPNARAVIRVPNKFSNPVTCFLHAQTYLAETSIGQELGSEDRVKIICVRSGTIAGLAD